MAGILHCESLLINLIQNWIDSLKKSKEIIHGIFIIKSMRIAPNLRIYMWQLKSSKINFTIKCSTESKVCENSSSVIFQLRLTENLRIINFINNKDLSNVDI